MKDPGPTRRDILTVGAACATAMMMSGNALAAGPATRRIPSSGEEIPAVGLGTWITFNVGNDPVLRDECAAVMASFFKAGGRLIDSSPMYGSSQDVIGYGLTKLGRPDGLFSADKIWTSSSEDGPQQFDRSRRRWSVPQFDLMQVHNLVGWEAHLPMLLAERQSGDLRYVGISTSDGRCHDLFEHVMRTQPLDFVQVTYNIIDRKVEERILPLAQDRGMAVIVNRPFRQGRLTEWLANVPLPDWAGEIGAVTWAQVILKFILSHPAVTVAIPATIRVDHAAENVAAAIGPLPDQEMRERMSAYVRNL